MDVAELKRLMLDWLSTPCESQLREAHRLHIGFSTLDIYRHATSGHIEHVLDRFCPPPEAKRRACVAMSQLARDGKVIRQARRRFFVGGGSFVTWTLAGGG
jgi:hypothetical protein